MKKVITYGTYDLFHEGHYKLLKRAKELGDYLIVGVTSESFDESRGKLNVKESLMQRIENVKSSGLADEIIIEEYEGQKVNDIIKYDIDIFTVGSDWTGKFDYLKEYCDVVYLERTKGISSTELRNEKTGILKLGIVGYNSIAERFIIESKYVSGVHIEGVFGLNENSAEQFVDKLELSFFSLDYDEFLDKIDAVYIAAQHLTHYDYIKTALIKGKHVMCEKPILLNSDETEELYDLAQSNGCILLEAIKTAYAPGFVRLINIAKSGIIGKIKNVDATFTKLVKGNLIELDRKALGGSMTELGSYPLLAAVKLLGKDIEETEFFSYIDDEKKVDLFTKINLRYKDAVFTGKVGLGVKSEGDLVISGTEGYIYVPAPWWKTEYFEVRFENINSNKKYYYKFEGDGLRYELVEFLSLINTGKTKSFKLTPSESSAIVSIIEKFIRKQNVKII